jgi:hypothetical protein
MRAIAILKRLCARVVFSLENQRLSTGHLPRRVALWRYLHRAGAMTNAMAFTRARRAGCGISVTVYGKSWMPQKGPVIGHIERLNVWLALTRGLPCARLY